MGLIPLVPFRLGDQCLALHLEAVERVIPAVEITSLPKAPEIVLGLINLGGKVIPVLNIRRRFRLIEREAALTDHFIIARTSRRNVALAVDSAEGVIQVSAEGVTEPKDILPALEYVEGVVRLKGGLLLIHDLEKFLSLEEEKTLGEVLNDGD
jgi:purine-binding chemotaxis protein CheW